MCHYSRVSTPFSTFERGFHETTQLSEEGLSAYACRAVVALNCRRSPGSGTVRRRQQLRHHSPWDSHTFTGHIALDWTRSSQGVGHPCRTAMAVAPGSYS